MPRVAVRPSLPLHAATNGQHLQHVHSACLHFVRVVLHGRRRRDGGRICIDGGPGTVRPHAAPLPLVIHLHLQHVRLRLQTIRNGFSGQRCRVWALICELIAHSSLTSSATITSGCACGRTRT